MPGFKDGLQIEPRVLMAVLFDPETGRIVHSHRVFLFDKKRQISQADVEQRARTLATRNGWDVEKLEMLSVDSSKLKERAKHKVDVKSRSLVEMERPKLKPPESHLRLKS